MKFGQIEQNSKEKAPDPMLQEFWHEYEFPGKPPFKNSISESRLKTACIEYANIVNNLESIHRASGDSENYVPHNKIVQKISASDSKRRELHNQIALLVVGKQRSGMDTSLAEHIAEFALSYSESM